MKTKIFDVKAISKYIVLLLMCFIFANTKVSNISPFLYSFFIACLYVGLDEKFMAGFTLSSALILNHTLENFLTTITVVASGLINFYIHKFCKKKIILVTNFIVYLVTLSVYIYYNYFDVLNLVLYVVLGLICLYIFTVVLQVALVRKNCLKLTLDEAICVLFVVAVFGIGFCNLSIFKFEIHRCILMLLIFICLSIGNPLLTFSATLSFSLGVAIGLNNLLPVAEFMILSLVVGVFTLKDKFKMIFLSLICDVFIQYYFVMKDISILYSLAPILLAGILFACIPNKLLNNLGDVVYLKNSDLSSRNLINITRKTIRKRMSELSNIFLDMKQIHINMIKKDLTKEEVVAMLQREVTNTCCKDCLDKNYCTRAIGTSNKSNIQTLIEIAVNKGKVTLLDLPANLSSKCGKVNNLIAIINRLIDEYTQYKSMLTDVNNVKSLLADQMGAVSNLLLDVGKEIDTNVKFDIAKENKIISRLLNLNIQCKEVLLYTEKNEDISAVLILKSDKSYNLDIEKVVSQVLKCPMQITSVTPLGNGDFNSVTLFKRSKYDCVFGLASCNKAGNDESGDCHSIIRLGRNKFLLALCDGMGSGKFANKTSAMTLGLIENFYKVGFDNEIILDSVNKLLSINNQENYSTLDVCLLDLDKEIADFIKVGAPFGIIKRENNIEIVET